MAAPIISTVYLRRPAYLRSWGGGVVFFLLYYATAAFHLRATAVVAEPATIWLPAGIGLVTLIVLGRWGLPVVATAAAAAYAPLWFAADGLSLAERGLHLSIAVGLETAQTALAYAMWRRFVPEGIQNWGAVVRFTGLVAMVPCVLITPLITANYLWVGAWAGLPPRLILAYASVMVLSNMLGVLLVTPIYQAALEEGWPPHRRRAYILVGLVLIFVVQFAAFRIDPNYIYLTVPILLLFSLASGSLLATIAALLLVVGTAEATVAAYGPFARTAEGVVYLPLLVYLLVLVVSSLVGRVQYSYLLRQRRDLGRAVAARTAELRQEVAARTAAAEAALAGERRFRALMEKSHESIALFDRQGRIIAEGASAISRIQQPPSASNENFLFYIHPSEQAATAAVFARALAHPGQTFTQTMRVRQSRGNYIWMEGAVTNLLDDEAVAAVVVNYRDVSERKRAEEQTAYQALLFGHISDAVISTDLNLVVRSWNRAAEEIYGWRAEEAIGRSLAELTQMREAPGTREQLMDVLMAVGLWKGEVVQLHRDGHRIPIYASVSVVRDADGQLGGLVAVNRDMTEQRRAWEALENERVRLAERVAERTAELQQANTDLQTALKTKDTFVASMSHELRTPLNTVLMLIELLEIEAAGPLTPKQRQHLQTLRSNSQHLLGLINDILDLAKLQANMLTVTRTKLLVADLCHGSLGLVRAQAERKHILIALALDPAAKVLQADEQRMRQILVNLLGNAIKFTPEGGRIGLKVQADAAAGRLCFTVWDMGIGIAAADFGRLFQPFVQLESGLARRYEGTGLGLALAAQLARLQDGDIKVQSEPGKGSEFTVWLPWEQEASA
jgi:PAS domain S-box-containing protein